MKNLTYEACLCLGIMEKSLYIPELKSITIFFLSLFFRPYEPTTHHILMPAEYAYPHPA